MTREQVIVDRKAWEHILVTEPWAAAYVVTPPSEEATGPTGDQPDSLTVNGHMFIHVAACPCDRIQAEVARLTASDGGRE